MSIGYYDRDGRPLTSKEWGAMLERQDKRRVAETTLPDGKWVSTVWLGLDHNFGGGPPLIFETKVFPSSTDFTDLDQERYATEAEAMAGHQVMVDKWRLPAPPSP